MGAGAPAKEVPSTHSGVVSAILERAFAALRLSDEQDEKGEF